MDSPTPVPPQIPPSSSPQLSSFHKDKPVLSLNPISIGVLVAVLAALALGVIWYLKKDMGLVAVTPPPASKPAPTAADNSVQAGLGASIYQTSQHPIQGNLPESDNPAEKTNTMQGLYTNPFE